MGKQTLKQTLKPSNSTKFSERSKILHFKVLEHHLEKIWKEFADAGFEPVLIKGWAAAQLYPKPFERQFSDIDLVFDPKDFERAANFLNDQNYPIAVDLHRGLRHLDTVPFEELFAVCVRKKCGSVEIRMPCPEDHLRVLCVHWLNDGGAPRERLWDIYHAVENREAGFSWENCLGKVNRKRRRWIICALALAHRYLGLTIDDLPFQDELADIPRWLIKAVEKEWASETKLKPLHQCLHDRRELWRQLKKRVPPNPIQATVETEGDFDRRPRIYYQAQDVLKRLSPSLKRLKQALLNINSSARRLRKHEKG